MVCIPSQPNYVPSNLIVAGHCKQRKTDLGHHGALESEVCRLNWSSLRMRCHKRALWCQYTIWPIPALCALSFISVCLSSITPSFRPSDCRASTSPATWPPPTCKWDIARSSDDFLHKLCPPEHFSPSCCLPPYSSEDHCATGCGFGSNLLCYFRELNGETPTASRPVKQDFTICYSKEKNRLPQLHNTYPLVEGESPTPAPPGSSPAGSGRARASPGTGRLASASPASQPDPSRERGPGWGSRPAAEGSLRPNGTHLGFWEGMGGGAKGEWVTPNISHRIWIVCRVA